MEENTGQHATESILSYILFKHWIISQTKSWVSHRNPLLPKLLFFLAEFLSSIHLFPRSLIHFHSQSKLSSFSFILFLPPPFISVHSNINSGCIIFPFFCLPFFFFLFCSGYQWLLISRPKDYFLFLILSDLPVASEVLTTQSLIYFSHVGSWDLMPL